MSSSIYRKLSFASFTVLLFVIVACGRWAKADKQVVETIEIPRYPDYQTSVFGLQAATEVTGYGGTLVLLDESLDPKDLADLLQASIDSRVAWATIRQFVQLTNYDELYVEGGEVDQTIEVLENDLAAYRRQAKQGGSLSEQELDKAKNSFLDGELELLFGENHDKPSRIEAETVLKKYCDAKLWQLATNSYFAERLYSERPSPFPFCEGFYAESGYFTTDICSSESNEQNFFSCLWHDGVFKTQRFLQYEATRREEIISLFNEENTAALRAILGIDDNVMTFKNERFRKNSIGLSNENRGFFADLIMQQSREKNRLCQAIIPDYKNLCTIFAASEDLSDVSDYLTPIELITTVEGSDVSSSENFKLPERKGSAFSTKDLLRYLGERNNQRNSEADRLYHKVVVGPPLERPSYSNTGFGLLTVAIEEALTGVVYPGFSDQDLAVIAEKLALINKLKAQRSVKSDEYAGFNEAIPTTSAKAFEVGNRPGLAHAFLEIRFKVSQRDNVLRAYFWLNGFEDSAVLGCYHHVEKVFLGENCEPDSMYGYEAENVRLAEEFRLDEETGRIDFLFKLEDAPSLGFKRKARATDDALAFESFNDFDASFYEGKNLRLELFPNRIYDALEVLTGKAFIEQGEEALYEAAVSLWDQNL